MALGAGSQGREEWCPANTVERKPGEKAQCDLSRLAKLHSSVPSPVPSAASTGQCLAQAQLVSPGALGTHNHPGSSPGWTIQAQSDPDGFEQEEEDDAKTISHNHWWSWGSFTPSLLGMWSNPCFPLQPWHCVTLTPSLCHQISQWLCSPGCRELHLQLEILPASSLCAWNAAKPHPAACTGISQSWAHLSGLSPEASHPSPCPGAPESWTGPATTSRMGFSGKMQHSCAWLLSPQWMGWAGVSSSPLFGARHRKASLCSPRVMALAVEMC